MRRLCKIFFIMLVLVWGAAGLRHAQGQRGVDDRQWQEADPGKSLEIFETGDETASTPSRIGWIASQMATWTQDYETEE
ncbi:MAG TPA: hypothetical protein VJT09_18435 [Pyrinomonadaceae bacterium]|nr:hypothetical protein [Pyrinomonadaceae bacterium]